MIKLTAHDGRAMYVAAESILAILEIPSSHPEVPTGCGLMFEVNTPLLRVRESAEEVVDMVKAALA